jgi:hypothetical protein
MAIGQYQIDTAISIIGTFVTVVGCVPVDPTTVSLILEDPTGVVQTLSYPVSISKTGIGMYTYTFTPTKSGVWIYKWRGTGDVIATSADTRLNVVQSVLISG